MAKKRTIPTRPLPDESGLKEIEKDALSYYVVFGAQKEFIYAKFLHPELQLSKTALKRATEMFFDDKDVIEYIKAYTDTIERFLNRQHSVSKMDEEDKQRIQLSAIDNAKDYILELLQDIQNSKDPETVLKLADKLNMLNLEEIYEQPRRYLPESCDDCRYKKWIEENCKETED